MGGEAGDSLCLPSSGKGGHCSGWYMGEAGLETTGEKGIKDFKQTFSYKNV